MQIILTVTKSAFPKGKYIIKAQIMGAPDGATIVWNRATPGTPFAAFGDSSAYAPTGSGNPLTTSYLYNAPTGSDTIGFNVEATVNGTLLNAGVTLVAQ